MKRQKAGSRWRADVSVTGELFQWSYRHLTENANYPIKGLERAEREKEGRTEKETSSDRGVVEKERVGRQLMRGERQEGIMWTEGRNRRKLGGEGGTNDKQEKKHGNDKEKEGDNQSGERRRGKT